MSKIEIPVSGETVVVDEGDFEPRSVGSYVLRVLRGASSFPTDNFGPDWYAAGTERWEAVRFADVDGDVEPEIAVVVRSVGSGGYVSADAFRYHSRSLQLIASVSNLEPEADPVMALRELFICPTKNRQSHEVSECSILEARKRI